MAKSKHRLGKGKKLKRSSPKGANTKLAPKKIKTIKPRNKTVMALFSAADLIKSKTFKIFAAFKTVANKVKEKARKAATPIKVAVIAVKTKRIKTVSTIKAVIAAVNAKRLKTIALVKVAAVNVKAKSVKAVSTVKATSASANAKRLKAVATVKAVSASVKTKWLPIVGVAFWNYIIAPVLAVVIVIRSRPRYMAAALLVIAIPVVAITIIAVSSPSTESGGAIPVILAADNADDNEVSDAPIAAEVNAEIQGETPDSTNETRLNATTLVCVAVILLLVALVLWAVIPRKSDPSVPLADIRNENESN